MTDVGFGVFFSFQVTGALWLCPQLLLSEPAQEAVPGVSSHSFLSLSWVNI